MSGRPYSERPAARARTAAPKPQVASARSRSTQLSQTAKASGRAGSSAAASTKKEPKKRRPWFLFSSFFFIPCVIVLSVGLYWWTNQAVSSGAEDDPVESPTLSSCESSIKGAADAFELNDGGEDLLIESASTCESVEEWVSAVKTWPASMGYDDASIVDPHYDLAGICGQTTGPVCQDARESGVLD